jgi:hypothetical protein
VEPERSSPCHHSPSAVDDGIDPIDAIFGFLDALLAGFFVLGVLGIDLFARPGSPFDEQKPGDRAACEDKMPAG